MFLFLSVMFAFTFCFTLDVHAATTEVQDWVIDIIDSHAPKVTYAMPASGANKIYAYSDSSLKTKESSHFICTYSDQFLILDISDNGLAIKARYPSTTAPSGYRDRWFKTVDVLGSNFDHDFKNWDEVFDFSPYKYVGSTKTTYRLASSTTLKSYGSIYTNDECAGLGDIKVGSKKYYRTIYPVSRAKLLGIYYKYKLGLVK